MATIYCTKCGSPITEGAKFCGKCGTPATVLPEEEQATRILDYNQIEASVEEQTMLMDSAAINSQTTQLTGQDGYQQQYHQHQYDPRRNGVPIVPPDVPPAAGPNGKKKGKGKIIGIVAGVVVVVILLVLTFTVFIPMSHISKGDKLLAAGDYSGAASEYLEAGSFGGAEDKVFEAAFQALEAEQFTTASSIFSQSTSDEATYYKDLCDNLATQGESAWDSLLTMSGCERGQNAAGAHFKAKNTIEGCQKAVEFYAAASNTEQVTECNYAEGTLILAKGESKLTSSDVSTAYDCFIAAGSYEDASDKATYCKNANEILSAEELYDAGQLPEAQTAFSNISSDITFNGISASGRLATLKKYKKYVNLCGTYTTSKAQSSVESSSTRWDSTGGRSVSITVKCKIKNNGKVKIMIDTTFYNMLCVSMSSSATQYDVTFNDSSTVSKMPKTIHNYKGTHGGWSSYGSGAPSYGLGSNKITFSFNGKNKWGDVVKASATCKKSGSSSGSAA